MKDSAARSRFVSRRLRLRAGVAAGAAWLLFMSIVALGGPAGAQGSTGTPAAGQVQTQRFGGADRYETALAIARSLVSDSGGMSERVVIASGRSWTDAVVAAPLTAPVGGGGYAPLLLSDPRSGLTPAVVAFIEDIGASSAVIVSTTPAQGSAAVPSEVDSQLKSIGVTAERLGGADASATSLAVAEHLAQRGSAGSSASSPTVFVASAEVFADSLVAGPLAARIAPAAPILLTAPSGLPSSVTAWLRDRSVSRAVVMGGTAAVSSNVDSQLGSLGIAAERIAGSSRYDTAVRAAQWAGANLPACTGPARAGLAVGTAPWDSFSSVPLLASRCAPLLLTGASKLAGPTQQWTQARVDGLATDATLEIMAFGGTAAISDAVLATLRGQPSPPDDNDGTPDNETPDNEAVTDEDLFDGDVLGEIPVGDLSWLAALEGTLTVPVFICGPAGQYTADDVRQATAQLNAGLDGFFHRLTSGRIDLVFSEGAPISINQDFEAARAGTQEAIDSILQDCDLGVEDASAVRINFVINEFMPCPVSGCGAFGGNSYVKSAFLPLDDSVRRLAIHELVHSVLRLHHLKHSLYGPILIDEDNIDRYGPEGYWNSLTRPPLACYQYEFLGWPVPEGYSEPCARFAPRGPVIWSADITDDSEMIIRWAPPVWFDAPITGYTLEIRDTGGGSQRQELPANARAATLRLSNVAKLAGFELGLWANSPEADYGRVIIDLGESEPAHSRGDYAESIVGFRTTLSRSGDPGPILVAPLPPRVGEVTVNDVTSGTVGLTWDAEELIRYETEHKTDGARQFHYQIERIASDLPDEDPDTTCPAVPTRGGQAREQAERTLVILSGCNPTNWVRGDTLYQPNDVFNYRTAETLSGGRAVEVEVIGLDPNTQYTFRVRTCSNASGLSCSRWSTATASTVGSSSLPAPSGIRIASGNDEVSGDWGLVTWDPVPGAAAYEFEVVEDGAIHIYGHSRRFEPSFDLSPLYESNAADVKFRIRSCKTRLHSCGDGEWTTVALPSSASRSTPPPYRVSVKEIEGASTTLGYWTPDWQFVGGGGPYALEYQYTDGTSDSGLQRRGGYRSYLELPTEPNKNYTVKMRNCEDSSTSGSRCSTWTTFAFSTSPATSSLAPPPVRVTDISGTSFRLAWGHVPGAFSYDWKIELESRFVTSGRMLASAVVTTGYVAPEYTPWVPPVEPGKEYTIMVRTCGALTRPCGEWATTKVST